MSAARLDKGIDLPYNIPLDHVMEKCVWEPLKADQFWRNYSYSSKLLIQETPLEQFLLEQNIAVGGYCSIGVYNFYSSKTFACINVVARVRTVCLGLPFQQSLGFILSLERGWLLHQCVCSSKNCLAGLLFQQGFHSYSSKRLALRKAGSCIIVFARVRTVCLSYHFNKGFILTRAKTL
jgi:hypothetical protein